MERQWQTVHDVVANCRGDHDLARLGRLMNTGCYIHPVALQDAVIVDHVVDVDRNPKEESGCVIGRVRARQRPLYVGGPLHGIYDAWEFSENGIPANDQPSVGFTTIMKEVRARRRRGWWAFAAEYPLRRCIR
jgi:hypothetical protein